MITWAVAFAIRSGRVPDADALSLFFAGLMDVAIVIIIAVYW